MTEGFPDSAAAGRWRPSVERGGTVRRPCHNGKETVPQGGRPPLVQPQPETAPAPQSPETPGSKAPPSPFKGSSMTRDHWIRRTLRSLTSGSARNRRQTRELRRSTCRLTVETLEERLVLALAVPGPAWLSVGPDQASLLGNEVIDPAIPNVTVKNPIAGAVTAVAVNPFHAERVVVGTAGGGIWRTDNATDAFPSWTSSTSQLPDLGIGDVEFSPLDNANQVMSTVTTRA